MKCKTVICLILIAAPFYESPVTAEEKKQLTWRQVALAASEKHPDIAILKIKRNEYTGGEVKAKALPNPETDSKIIYDIEKKNVGGEVTVTQKIELGGKRNARLRDAMGRKQRYLLSLKIRREEVTAETVILLHRLNQIRKETEELRETRATMKSLIARYRRLPRLTPELSVSRSLYILVAEETESNMALLESERFAIAGRLSRWTGFSREELSAAYFPLNIKFSDPGKLLPADSPRLLLLEEEILLADARLSLEKALAVPDISLGPSFSGSGTGSSRELAAGLTISMPIPLMNRNQGGKKIAEARLFAARRKKLIEKERLIDLRHDLVDRYSKLVTGMKKKKNPDMEKRHRIIHRLMNKGLVSPSLIIEFHRQSIESLKSSHSIEAEALRLLWTIKSLDAGALQEVRRDER